MQIDDDCGMVVLLKNGFWYGIEDLESKKSSTPTKREPIKAREAKVILKDKEISFSDDWPITF